MAVASYQSARSFGFIYDDYWTIVGNTHLDKPLRELVAAAVSGRSVEWGMPDATRPWIGFTLWLDRQLFGLSPEGYHIHSLALYALACALVFLLAFGLLRRFVPALCAGVVFAALPLHVEVAVAINYREDLIAAIGLFGAGALWFWPTPSALRWRNLGCGLLWAYALLGKESALIGPAFIAALSIARRTVGLRPRTTPPIVLVVGAVAALWLNWRFGMSRLGEQIPTANFSWLERLTRTARFEVIAFWKSFVPFGPLPEREAPGSAHLAWVLPLALIVTAIVWLARRRRTRVLAAAGAVALVSPLCASPLFAPLNELADRYWFLGSLAAALLIGWAATQMPARRAALWVAVLAGACCVASSRASSVWASEVDLWSMVVQNAPGSARAWAAVSRVHRLANQEDLAQRSIERALGIKPNNLPALTANVLNDLWFGRLSAARERLHRMEGMDTPYGDSLRVARRCALLDVDAARACVRHAVPTGMVLGDPERLRAVSERLLAEPLAPPASLPPQTWPRAVQPAPLEVIGPDGGTSRTPEARRPQ